MRTSKSFHKQEGGEGGGGARDRLYFCVLKLWKTWGTREGPTRTCEDLQCLEISG